MVMMVVTAVIMRGTVLFMMRRLVPHIDDSDVEQGKMRMAVEDY